MSNKHSKVKSETSLPIKVIEDIAKCFQCVAESRDIEEVKLALETAAEVLKKEYAKIMPRNEYVMWYGFLVTSVENAMKESDLEHAREMARNVLRPIIEQEVRITLSQGEKINLPKGWEILLPNEFMVKLTDLHNLLLKTRNLNKCKKIAIQALEHIRDDVKKNGVRRYESETIERLTLLIEKLKENEYKYENEDKVSILKYLQEAIENERILLMEKHYGKAKASFTI